MRSLASVRRRQLNGRRFVSWGAAALVSGLLIGGLAAPGAAFASSSETWTGNGDGHSWSDANNWNGGVPQAGDSVTIAPTQSQSAPSVTDAPSISLQHLTLTNSSLAGGALTVTGDFSWSVSTGQNVLDAPLTAAGPATISGAGTKIAFGQLTFEDTTTVSGPGVLETEFGGAAITNTGTFRIDPGASVEANACCATLNKFINTGVLAVPSGGIATLAMMGLTIGGVVSVSPDSTLDVIGGPAAFSHGSTVKGGGTLLFELGETVKLAPGVATAQGSTVELTGNASLTGTGGFTGSGTFLWTGGNVEGNLDIGRTVTTLISGGAIKEAVSPNGKPITVTLRGVTTVSGSGPVELGQAGNLDNEGTLFANQGTTFDAGLCCANPNKFANSGTLIVQGGKKPVRFSLLAFLNRGTVKLSGRLLVSAVSYTQTAGVTNIAGGSLSSKQPVLIKGGTLTGHGTVGAPVVNSGGIVSPSNTDVLTINGSYQQTKSGTFAVELASARKSGQLVVEGAATLSGAIKVLLANGFKPKKGQSFQVMRYRSHAGSFTKTLGTPKYKVSYGGSVHIKY